MWHQNKPKAGGFALFARCPPASAAECLDSEGRVSLATDQLVQLSNLKDTVKLTQGPQFEFVHVVNSIFQMLDMFSGCLV